MTRFAAQRHAARDQRHWAKKRGYKHPLPATGDERPQFVQKTILGGALVPPSGGCSGGAGPVSARRAEALAAATRLPWDDEEDET